MSSRLTELREVADGVKDEAFSYIYKPVNAAELRFAQTFNPKRVRALLGVAEAAEAVKRIADAVPEWKDSPALIALGKALAAACSNVIGDEK